jgi:predicted RNA-binding Zn-ribbon protein involved in translation (DUF1610 family)
VDSAVVTRRTTKAMTMSNCLTCGKEIKDEYQSCPDCGQVITPFLREYRNSLLAGNYRPRNRLGRGGMGEVYRATHVHLGSDVVIKVIRPGLDDERGVIDRFVREAVLARKIRHPNVALLYEFSALPDGSYFMVWEFIEGENLRQVIHESGALAPERCAHLSIDALQGLEAIHRAGVVHRDISPDKTTTDHTAAIAADQSVRTDRGGHLPRPAEGSKRTVRKRCRIRSTARGISDARCHGIDSS